MTYNGELLENDRPIIATSVGRIGNTSISYHQELQKGGESVADLELVVVLVDSEGKPTTIPDDIKSRLIEPIEEERK